MTYFIIPEQIYFHPHQKEKSEELWIFLNGNHSNSIHNEYPGHLGGGDSLKYDSLVKKHNDVAYNNFVSLELDHRALACVVNEVIVISNEDYDVGHPSGSLLNDVASIRFWSFAPFINSGYNFDSLKGKSNQGEMPFDMPLSDFTPAHGSLWENGYCEIYFPMPPSLSKRHTFTVTFSFDDGTTLSGVAEVQFE